MSDWILKAIEREAMHRAREELQRFPMTWRYMGFDPEQVRVMVVNAIQRGAQPNMSGPEINELLK